MKNNSDLQGHIDRNNSMWKIWEEHGVNEETELTVNFHFSSPNRNSTESLCKELLDKNIRFSLNERKKFIFFRTWEISADVEKKWSLYELQEMTKVLFSLSKNVGVTLEGLRAKMPKKYFLISKISILALNQ